MPFRWFFPDAGRSLSIYGNDPPCSAPGNGISDACLLHDPGTIGLLNVPIYRRYREQESLRQHTPMRPDYYG
jgi:hypothetical protein